MRTARRNSGHLPFKCVPLGTTRRHYEWDAYPRVQLRVTYILIPLCATRCQYHFDVYYLAQLGVTTSMMSTLRGTRRNSNVMRTIRRNST